MKKKRSLQCLHLPVMRVNKVRETYRDSMFLFEWGVNQGTQPEDFSRIRKTGRAILLSRVEFLEYIIYTCSSLYLEYFSNKKIPFLRKRNNVRLHILNIFCTFFRLEGNLLPEVSLLQKPFSFCFFCRKHQRFIKKRNGDH